MGAEELTALGCALVEVLFQYFGEGASPDYGKSLIVAGRDPHRPLRERLDLQLSIDDSTDLNYDLGSSWWWLNRSGETLNLRLSFVGPFATLIRHPDEVVTDDAVLDLVRSSGFVVLDRSRLEASVPIWEPEVQGTLYEFLFEFDKGTPWNRQ